jgi:hypothetical protein
MDELDRALAAAQERYEEKRRAEVDEKRRTEEAIAWFGWWATQVGMPTLSHLVDRLLAAGHKAVVAPTFDENSVITDITFTFTQENGPGTAVIDFRRGNEQSVAVFFAVNGTQGTGGRLEPPDPATVDRFAKTYIIQALEGPSW